MARYAVNFAVTVWVDTDEIKVGELNEDITDKLTDNEWNSLVDDALNDVEIGGGNLVSIERIEE